MLYTAHFKSNSCVWRQRSELTELQWQRNVKLIGPVRQGCNQACHELFCKKQLQRCTSTLQSQSYVDTPRRNHCKLDTNHVIMASEQGEVERK